MTPVRSHHIAEKILHELLPYRRRFSDTDTTITEEELNVASVQIPRLQEFIERGERITCVIPAFPAKSPNPNKVLGCLPDMAERISLSFLNHICQRIQLHYKPGATIMICSDGHVFGDLIRVSDPLIDAYQERIEDLIVELGATNLSVFHLGHMSAMSDFCLEKNYDALRATLVDRYAETVEEIDYDLKNTEDGIRLYRAITRFLFEDSQLPGTVLSKSALQRDAKSRTNEVVRRSRAWGNLLADLFPESIRLSIHPQASTGLKIGIHMMPTLDEWLTPWHGVAANVGGRYMLMKRRDVVDSPHELVHINGSPSHYVIKKEDEIKHPAIRSRVLVEHKATAITHAASGGISISKGIKQAGRA